jgi:hypothetical protein
MCQRLADVLRPEKKMEEAMKTHLETSSENEPRSLQRRDRYTLLRSKTAGRAGLSKKLSYSSGPHDIWGEGPKMQYCGETTHFCTYIEECYVDKGKEHSNHHHNQR